MSVFFIPALISLIFKLVILFIASREGKVSVLFLSLIVIFACHNAIELVGYIQFINNEAVVSLFRPYYVVTTFLVMYVLLHGLAVSERGNRYVTGFLITVATVLSTLILFTDVIVSGQYSIGYAMTAMQGQYYWLFALYLLAVLLTNTVVLLVGYKGATSQLHSIRCAYSLFALSPVMVVALLAITLKISGVGVNAAGLAPIATTLFLIFVLKGESQHQFTDIRRFLPFSPERKAVVGFMRLIDEYIHSENKINAFKNLRDGIERQIIYYTLDKCDNNITKCSEMMGLESRSTLYSMMNRLGINHRKRNESP